MDIWYYHYAMNLRTLSTNLVVLFVLLIPAPSLALQTLSPDSEGNVSLESTRTFEEFVTVYGKDIAVRSSLTKGGLLIGGGTIDINHSASGPLLLIGNVIKINQSVVGDVLVIANQFTLASEAQIDGDLLVAFANINTIEGNITGDVKVLKAAFTHINGTIAGNLSIQSDQLTFGDQGKINGKLSGRARTDQIINDKIAGSVEIINPQQTTIQIIQAKARSFTNRLIGGMLLLWVLNWALPKNISNVRDAIFLQPLSNLLTGILAIITWPILILILLPFSFTWPLGLTAGVIFLLTLIVGILMGTIWLGDALTKKNLPILISFALGWLVLAVMNFIPILGAWLTALIIILGFGSIIEYLRKTLLAFNKTK